jgi:hypothetical protein
MNRYSGEIIEAESQGKRKKRKNNYFFKTLAFAKMDRGQEQVCTD